jgi:hypothetical protein
VSNDGEVETFFFVGVYVSEITPGADHVGMPVNLIMGELEAKDYINRMGCSGKIYVEHEESARVGSHVDDVRVFSFVGGVENMGVEELDGLEILEPPLKSYNPFIDHVGPDVN